MNIKEQLNPLGNTGFAEDVHWFNKFNTLIELISVIDTIFFFFMSYSVVEVSFLIQKHFIFLYIFL
jgi:hypothetical protein